MTEIGEFEIPDKEKYLELPRNLKAELADAFEAQQGKKLIAFTDGRTKWTPTIGTAFSKLLNTYHAYYLDQRPQNLVNQ